MSNIKLADVVRYMRYRQSKLRLKYIHGKDKMDIFLYLYERWLIKTEREPFDFSYTITLNDDGFIQMVANLSDEDVEMIENEIRAHIFERIPNVSLSLYEKSYIDFLFDKYGMMDYDSLIERLFSESSGEAIAPEVHKYLSLPFLVEKDYFINVVLGR